MNQRPFSQHRLWLTGLALALIFVVTACGPTKSQDSYAGGEVAPPKEAQPSPEAEILPAVGDVSDSNDAETISEEPVEAPPPIQRNELEATDPANVSLASGKIQLVEFFAFW